MRAVKAFSFLCIALWNSRFGGAGMFKHQIGVLIFFFSWYWGPCSKFSPPIAGSCLPKDYCKYTMSSWSVRPDKNVEFLNYLLHFSKSNSSNDSTEPTLNIWYVAPRHRWVKVIIFEAKLMFTRWAELAHILDGLSEIQKSLLESGANSSAATKGCRYFTAFPFFSISLYPPPFDWEQNREIH